MLFLRYIDLRMLASVTNILSGGSKKTRSIFIGNIWTTPPILGGVHLFQGTAWGPDGGPYIWTPGSIKFGGTNFIATDPSPYI